MGEAMVQRGTGLSRQVYRLALDIRRQAIAASLAEDGLETNGMRPMAPVVLTMLAHSGARSQRQISETLDIEASDLVSILDQLESGRLVVRRKDPQDRRRNLVELTQQGSAAAARLVALGATVEDRAFARLDTAQRRQLGELLSLALGDEVRPS